MKSRALLVCIGMILWPSVASATFSIVACDETRSCGAAVATNNLAVGASVIYVRAGAGAIATQFETNPNYGAKGLFLLAQGRTAEAVLKALLAEDGNFDGQDTSYRQVGIVAADGNGASYTGEQAQASGWAGALTGPEFSVQGNGLAGMGVLNAMRDAFIGTKGPLAERLLVAIEAGEAAGGQSTGRLSAALLVRTPKGGWDDIDLRVDAAKAPIPDLHRLLDMHRANEALIRGERAWRGGRKDEARREAAEAARLAPGWDRLWRRIARLALSIGDLAQARAAFATFADLNPAWAKIERADSFYAPMFGGGSNASH